MANARILRWQPNATYISLGRGGILRWGNTNFMFPVGGTANFSGFRYQHVGMPKQIFAFRVSPPTRKFALAPTSVVLRCSGI